ncbi:hypothetical protein YM3MPS_26450 [Mycobacterium pseudoshottsii]|uniref:O-acyltransferase WSD1-like N-terminal domain-containing protein n=1 Tax=Mycobacterium pseudoshottsii TaxID=265949 RepID=A0A9N7QKX0_9MYCO|nr:hypothetical protein NJB1907Z4_C26630 [Mycobacterium pseudoshottsii]BEH76842.1 hypothetical protein YM3MPS_26450 [Mycobacterium pseudoshottsii]
MTEFMRKSDAFTWSMESDPRLRSTVVTVLLLDRSPDWDEVRQRFDLISREMPMFRQRVVESPPPAPPRWEPDADFELDYHMRRVTVSGAGTFEDVLEMARLAEMQDFDRARALWETTLIEGLQDGGAAVICKFHHALTDGVGGVQIAMHLFDLSAEVGAHPSLPAVAELPRHSWLDGYRRLRSTRRLRRRSVRRRRRCGLRQSNSYQPFEWAVLSVEPPVFRFVLVVRRHPRLSPFISAGSFLAIDGCGRDVSAG